MCLIFFRYPLSLPLASLIHVSITSSSPGGGSSTGLPSHSAILAANLAPPDSVRRPPYAAAVSGSSDERFIQTTGSAREDIVSLDGDLLNDLK